MTKTTPQKQLDALRSAFLRLQLQHLPPEARAPLQDAMQYIDKLSEIVAADTERSRLEVLYRVSRVLGESLDLNEVLTRVMDAVIELTQAERGFLMLVDPDSGRLDLRAARNLEQETLESRDMEVSRTVIRNVIETGQGVIATDAQNDPRFAAQDSVILYSLRSVMCAPLRVRDRIAGVVYLDNRAQSGLFTAQHLEMLNAFASQAAIAIDNARLYTQTDQALAERVSELETLTQIDRELNAQLDFTQVVDIARRWAVQGTGAADGWIALLEQDTSLHIVAGFDETRQAALSAELGKQIERCLSEPSSQNLAPQEGSPARLIVPIQYTNKPVGILVVERPEPFFPTALQFLERLAGRAASAIQNARLYRAVQDANQAKTTFVSVVTHELRIPMTSIKGYTDLLRGGMVGPINEMQTNFLDVIRKNVERMSVLVSDLSDISHIETGKMKLSLSAVDMGENVDQVLQTVKPKIDEKQQTLSVSLPENLPQVNVDPNRLAQVLTNLVSNASKYTDPEGKIDLCARLEEGFIRVEVRDTGLGISAEDQKSLFTQFFRSEDPMVREQQGWGLGLNVTQRLVELMGGQIGVQSEYRQGSLFWFTVPVYQAETV
jgi:signal transduction histidine kinase